MNQKSIRMVAGDGFSKLLERPFCGRMRRHIEMQNAPEVI
jgi:hypothetical protein